MSYILDIATAVPPHSVSNAELTNFYAHAVEASGLDSVRRKLKIISDKTKIKNRYSCVPDFNGRSNELFTTENYEQSVERRTAIYKEKIMPLAISAIDKLLHQTNCKPAEITHLITVSCTGVFAPGFEFSVAKHYDLNHTEKLGVNFLGCYAAVKAIKHAHYIASAVPSACILIICTELCSLHFTPSITDDDILSNLLFADGAAATMVVGNENKKARDKTVLDISAISSAFIPNTLDLMTWNISSTAFKMHLSKFLVDAIRENVSDAINGFIKEASSTADYWAIHPGGVRIVDAVKQSLDLSDHDVQDSLAILENYGNMSSPTILFVLQRIFDKIKEAPENENKNKNIITCAFGPGLTIEMMNLSVVNTSTKSDVTKKLGDYAIQK